MMSFVWTVAPVAFALGAVLALVQLRGIAEATADLQVELHRLSKVHLAVAEFRSATAEARTSARHPLRA